MSNSDVRIEKDTFGPIEVPADATVGRADAAQPAELRHLRASACRGALIRALVLVKKAAALVNHGDWLAARRRRPRPS